MSDQQVSHMTDDDKKGFVKALGARVRSAAKKVAHAATVAAKAVATVVTAPIALLARAAAWLLSKAVKVVTWVLFTLAAGVSLILLGAATLVSIVLTLAFKVVYFVFLALMTPWAALHGGREAVKSDWTLYFHSWKFRYFNTLTVQDTARREMAESQWTQVTTPETALDEPHLSSVKDEEPVKAEPVKTEHHAKQAPKGHPTPRQRKRRPARPPRVSPEAA